MTFWTLPELPEGMLDNPIHLGKTRALKLQQKANKIVSTIHIHVKIGIAMFVKVNVETFTTHKELE